MSALTNEEFIARLSDLLVGREIQSYSVENGIHESDGTPGGWYVREYDGTKKITIEIKDVEEGVE